MGSTLVPSLGMNTDHVHMAKRLSQDCSVIGDLGGMNVYECMHPEEGD